MRYIPQPVGAPALSAIGRALGGAVDRTADSYLRHAAIEQERERRDREMGIVPEEEISRQKVFLQDPNARRPVATVPSPIARAVSPPPPAEPGDGGTFRPEVVGAPRPETAPTQRVQMAGPVAQQEVATEDYLSLGDGKAYAPGRDRELQIRRARAQQEAQAEMAMKREIHRTLIPAAERVRAGKGTAEDVLTLAAAGIDQKDLEDPKSELNREIERIQATTTAREAATEPFRSRREEARNAEWDRREGVQRQERDRREATRRDAKEPESGNSWRNRDGSINRTRLYNTVDGYAATLAESLFSRAPAGFTNPQMVLPWVRSNLRAQVQRDGLPITEGEIQEIAARAVQNTRNHQRVNRPREDDDTGGLLIDPEAMQRIMNSRE